MSTTTPNLGLTTPSANDTDYPTSVSDSFTAIDLHDHSSGKGVQVVSAGITDLAVTAAKIAANAVTTAKILDGNVTQAKRVALGQQISASCGVFSTTSTTPTFVDVTNLSVTITTTGRPVALMLISDGANVPGGSIGVSESTLAAKTAMSAQFQLLEGVVVIASYEVGSIFPSTTSSVSNSAPSSNINMIRPVAAGTYTYKLQAAMSGVSAATTAFVLNSKLVAYEL